MTAVASAVLSRWKTNRQRTMKTNIAALLSLPLLLAIEESTRAQTVVSISAPDAVAAETSGNEALNSATIRFSRTGSTTAPLNVWVKVRGTALFNTDYTFSSAVGGFVTIPAGQLSHDITVLPRDDAFTETTETIRIDLEDETSAGAAVPYSIGGSDRAEVELRDNENPNIPPRAIVSVISPAPGVAETSAIGASFRLNREGNLAVEVAVQFALGGTATPEVDYESPAAPVIIPVGATFADVLIRPINDMIVESPESITLTLLAHPNINDPAPPNDAYALGFVANSTMTIVSEDVPPPPVVTFGSPALSSSQSAPGTIPIAFHATDPAGYITRFALTDGNTVLASNFVSYPSIPPAGTPFDFSLTLTNVRAGLHLIKARVWSSTGQAGTSPVAQIVVTNIPPVYPKMSVTALDADAAEGSIDGVANPAVFVISVDIPMPSDQYVVYRLSSPGPGYDFEFPSSYSATNWPMYWPVGPTDYGYAYFPSGSTRVEIVAQPVDDQMNEGDETLTLTLSYPFVFTERTFEGIVQFTEGGFHTPPFDPYALPPRYFDYDLTTNTVATAVIRDNDFEPTPFAIVSVTATDADAEETFPGAAAPNPGVFTISRVGPTNLPLVVNYSLVTRPRDIPLRFPIPVQAINGVDFESIPSLGAAVIPAGALSTDIVISPIQDFISEIGEYVLLQLRPSAIPVPDPSSYLLHTNTTANIVIRDLTLPAFTPIVRIKTLDGQAIEQNAISPHAVFQIERHGNIADALTVPYSIGGTASNGLDYVALPGAVTFAPGVRSVTLTIIPYLDNETEPDETVVLRLLPPADNLYPPPYVLGSSGPMVTSAGATIREDAPPTGPIDRFERARRLRFPGRYRIVPLPVLPEPAAARLIWAVEASSDFTVWTEIGETEDPEEFLDVDVGTDSSRFYRFREVTVPAP